MTETIKCEHTALRCLVTVARHHGVDLSLEGLIHEYAVGNQEAEAATILAIAEENGFKARRLNLTWDELPAAGAIFPFLGVLNNGNTVMVAGMREDNGELQVAVVDPLSVPPGAIFVSRAQFEASWSGRAILLKKLHRITDENQPFSLRWFIPEMLRQRSTFVDVALAAIALHVLALATPLFFQIVIDKVVVHQSFSTLHVLGVGMLFVLLFDALFHYLRGTLLLHATCKIDLRVATRAFTRLVSLPLQFFDHTSSGILVKHMQQTEKIREFLTGKLFFTMLDATALLVLLPVLLFYSVPLSLLVLGCSFMIALAIYMVVKPFRARLQDLYQAEGERQSYLVEAIHGIHTVKSLALEPMQRKGWDNRIADAVSMHAKVGRISISVRTITGLLEKLMILAIPWVGVQLVFDGSMTIGALVAFQMLAGRVSGPLIQIVSLVHEYQEASLSVRMVGEIMNRAPEGLGAGRGLRPPITGKIALDQVTFRYQPGATPALSEATLNFDSGKVIGVVGKSGSGKSTLTRLIQGLYPVQQGAIRFDGMDIREIDLPYLRRSIGVVLQENFLFRGSVRSNIAITKTDATFEEIVEVARLAGADEFIQRLPQGYDTLLEENGSNLSGGQKQRLAIARALLTKPRILIFDEATSALDPESESIIQENLAAIAHGRTVIMVSHRLSMLVAADSIVVMEAGRVIAIDPHLQLLGHCAVYRNLWDRQNRLGAAAAPAALPKQAVVA